ncbi:his operon leader peptide [Siccibacter turicensis]|uniref:his operon leader peptide n=1 Tax=Siccibacter turicensis TaxID=357233 RepID=A0A2P8VK26_9ENTR|nr:his operon leader peptide [Siccibacter turicensis]MDY0973043.1 his operon leader peptide [Siccibacter turicensis]PSN07909.1 his operon leader peptide [Siccibacter turicensis]
MNSVQCKHHHHHHHPD